MNRSKSESVVHHFGLMRRSRHMRPTRLLGIAGPALA